MKLKEIKPNMAIHCKTEEEAQELIKWAYECGFKWGAPFDNSYTFWRQPSNKDKLYSFDNHNWIYFNPISIDNIIEFSDLIVSNKEIKFKVGDVVITKKRGESWLVTDIEDDERPIFYRCMPRFVSTDKTYIFKEDEIELSTEKEDEEPTAKEVIQWLMDGCFDSRLYDIGGEDGDLYSVFDSNSAEEVVNKIKQYNKKSKEPEIEWVYCCYESTGKPFRVDYVTNENEAIRWCEEKTIAYYGRDFIFGYKKVCRIKEK